MIRLMYKLNKKTIKMKIIFKPNYLELMRNQIN